MAGNSGGGGVFLLQDITESILLRLPTASCIGRFRCVSKSWRALLSDPQFILKILFFPNNPKSESSLRNQILIAGGADAATPFELPRRYRYSLLSPDTLRPVPNAQGGDLPSDRLPRQSLIVAGCCDGIFCIVDTNPDINKGGPDVILWNPATSETKKLPASTAVPPRTFFPHNQITGFGFDPRTNDYKVARILYFDDAQDDVDEAGFPAQILPPLAYAEVYSLRNRSWKRLTINDDLIPHLGNVGHCVRQGYNHDSPENQRRRRNCNWFYAAYGVCFTLSFDMTEEVFESTFITLPPPLRGQRTFSIGCFMLKDSLHAVFRDYSEDCHSYSVWCMLKHQVAESWIRLYTFPSPVWIVKILQVWKQDRYICSRQNLRRMRSQPHDVGETDGVYIFSPSTGEYGDRIEIQGGTTAHPFQAHIFTQTQVSLSDFE